MDVQHLVDEAGDERARGENLGWNADLRQDASEEEAEDREGGVDLHDVLANEWEGRFDSVRETCGGRAYHREQSEAVGGDQDGDGQRGGGGGGVERLARDRGGGTSDEGGLD